MTEENYLSVQTNSKQPRVLPKLVFLLLMFFCLCCEAKDKSGGIWKVVVHGNSIEKCMHSPESPEAFAKHSGTNCVPELIPSFGIYTLNCAGHRTAFDYALTQQDCENYIYKFTALSDGMFAKQDPRGGQRLAIFSSCFDSAKKTLQGARAVSYCKCAALETSSTYSESDLEKLSPAAQNKLALDIRKKCVPEIAGQESK